MAQNRSLAPSSTRDLVSDEHLAVLNQILVELRRLNSKESGSPLNRSLTRKQAAAYLGLHEKTLGELTATSDTPGKITGYKTGSRWKYRIDDLDQYRELMTKPSHSRRIDRDIDWSKP